MGVYGDLIAITITILGESAKEEICTQAIRNMYFLGTTLVIKRIGCGVGSRHDIYIPMETLQRQCRF